MFFMRLHGHHPPAGDGEITASCDNAANGSWQFGRGARDVSNLGRNSIEYWKERICNIRLAYRGPLNLATHARMARLNWLRRGVAESRSQSCTAVQMHRDQTLYRGNLSVSS